MEQEKLIKVRDAENRESMWAEDLGDNKAKLMNTSFSGTYALYDIVEYEYQDGFNNITKLIEREMITMIVQYVPVEPEELEHIPLDEIKKKFTEVCNHLDRHGIECEGVVAGILVASIPEKVIVGIDAIMDVCPVECEYVVNYTNTETELKQK